MKSASHSRATTLYEVKLLRKTTWRLAEQADISKSAHLSLQNKEKMT